MTASTLTGLGTLGEVALVSFQPAGGSADNFAGIIDEIGFGGFERGVEGIPLVNGGRLSKKSPQTDMEVTLKLYPTDLGWATQRDLLQGYLTTDDGFDSTASLTIQPTHNIERYQVCILFTEDYSIKKAQIATTAGRLSRRYVFKNARITKYEPSFDDKTNSASVTLNIPVFDESGTANITFQSAVNGSGTGLSAVSTWTPL